MLEKIFDFFADSANAISDIFKFVTMLVSFLLNVVTGIIPKPFDTIILTFLIIVTAIIVLKALMGRK